MIDTLVNLKTRQSSAQFEVSSKKKVDLKSPFFLKDRENNPSSFFEEVEGTFQETKDFAHSPCQLLSEEEHLPFESQPPFNEPPFSLGLISSYASHQVDLERLSAQPAPTLIAPSYQTEKMETTLAPSQAQENSSSHLFSTFASFFSPLLEEVNSAPFEEFALQTPESFGISNDLNETDAIRNQAASKQGNTTSSPVPSPPQSKDSNSLERAHSLNQTEPPSFPSLQPSLDPDPKKELFQEPVLQQEAFREITDKEVLEGRFKGADESFALKHEKNSRLPEEKTFTKLSPADRPVKMDGNIEAKTVSFFSQEMSPLPLPPSNEQHLVSMNSSANEHVSFDPTFTPSPDISSQAATTEQAPSGLSRTTLENIAVYIQQSGRNMHSFNFQLTPASLGSITVKLHFSKEGGVKAEITSEKESTHRLLAKQSDDLQNILKDLGIQIQPEDFTFHSGERSNLQQNLDLLLINEGEERHTPLAEIHVPVPQVISSSTIDLQV